MMSIHGDSTLSHKVSIHREG
jgi:hypothetical protein